MSRARSLLATPALVVVLAGCTTFEPRASDPLGTKVAKGVVYVPASLAFAAGHVATYLVSGAARDRGEGLAADADLGGREFERPVFGPR